MILLIVLTEKYGVCGKLNNNDYFFNKWAIFTGLLQMMDYDLNLKQISNDKIFEELQKQDKILEQQKTELQNQTNIYLKKIIKQNEKIINILDK